MELQHVKFIPWFVGGITLGTIGTQAFFSFSHATSRSAKIVQKFATGSLLPTVECEDTRAPEELAKVRAIILPAKGREHYCIIIGSPSSEKSILVRKIAHRVSGVLVVDVPPKCNADLLGCALAKAVGFSLKSPGIFSGFFSLVGIGPRLEANVLLSCLRAVSEAAAANKSKGKPPNRKRQILVLDKADQIQDDSAVKLLQMEAKKHAAQGDLIFVFVMNQGHASQKLIAEGDPKQLRVFELSDTRLPQQMGTDPELEELVMRMAEERVHLHESTKNAQERASQLEKTLDEYRTLLQKTSLKLDELEQENSRLKANGNITTKDAPPTILTHPSGQDESTVPAAPLAPAPPAPPAPAPPPPPPSSKAPKPPPPSLKKLGGGPSTPQAKSGPIPKVKMMQFNWKKVNVSELSATGPPSFWTNVADRTDDLASEFGNLEDMFGARKELSRLKLDFGAQGSPGGGHEDRFKSTTITLLDFKRVQALSILLSRMKLTNDEIREAILTLDAEKISPEDLATLSKNAPTPEEIEMLKAYPDDPSTLGKPEQFYLAIMDIPRLSQKLESFLFTQKFESQAAELKPDIDTVLQASLQLKDSAKFARVLEIVLALGNFVNGGTFRGGFYGFKLDSLLSLQDVRSPSDPKLSLLNYFARLLREKYPELVNVFDELPALENAKRISLQTIASEIGTMRKELRAAAQEAEESKNEKEAVSEVLGASIEKIAPQFEDIDQKFNEAQKAFAEVVSFFGEDPRTTTPEEFFSIITKFAAQLEAAHKDAANERERAEKEAKRAANAAQRTHTPVRKSGSAVYSRPETPQKENLFVAQQAETPQKENAATF